MDEAQAVVPVSVRMLPLRTFSESRRLFFERIFVTALVLAEDSSIRGTQMGHGEEP
jgi:hypothetical protein